MPPSTSPKPVISSVISALPSNATPEIFLGVASVVAVVALPVRAPVNPVEETEVNPVTVLSRFKVTEPVVPPPFKLVPATTSVMSPTCGPSDDIKTFFVVPSVICYIE